MPPLLGGAIEKMWFALGKAFAAQGHQVVHISRQYADLPREELLDGVLHKRVPGYTTPASGLLLKWRDLRYTLRTRALVPADSDVVVCNTFWAPVLLPAALRRRAIPDVQRMPKGQMRLYRQAARLRANSTPVADAIRRELPPDQHARVVMVPNPLPFEAAAAPPLASRQPVILYAGRIHPEKGLELLLQAFATLPPGWKLQLVGPSDVGAGGGGPAYLARLRELAGAANVEFTGPVYDMERLNQLYAAAAVFAYPSVAEQGETFGLAPLEAMAWGCVPVVSNLACFHDFICHEQNGLIFDHRHPDAVTQLAGALARLQTDSALRHELAQRALAVRHTHSISGIAAQFLQEFARVVQEQLSQSRYANARPS